MFSHWHVAWWEQAWCNHRVQWSGGQHKVSGVLINLTSSWNIQCMYSHFVRFGIFSTKSGGCIVLVGLGKPEVTIPIVNAAVREVLYNLYNVLFHVYLFHAGGHSWDFPVCQLLPHSYSYGCKWEGRCQPVNFCLVWHYHDHCCTFCWV